MIAMPLDLSKAFIRMLHSQMFIDLEAINVPSCAITFIKSYLSQRNFMEQHVHSKNVLADPKADS